MRTVAALGIALALAPSPAAAEPLSSDAVAGSAATRSAGIIDRKNLLRTSDGVYVPGADGKLRILPGADPDSFECFADPAGRPALCRDARRAWGLRLEPLPHLDAQSLRALVGGCTDAIVGYRDADGYYDLHGARVDRPIGLGCGSGK